MSKVIIFDFDGTIADTLDTVIRIINRVAVEFGYQPVSQPELAEWKNLTARQIIKKSGVSIFKLPFFIKKAKAELNQEIQTVHPFPGIPEVLQELKKSTKQMGIITSNSQANVMLFIKQNNLEDIFDFVYSGSTLFGKSQLIDGFLERENIRPEEVIYVGDETRDIEAARRSQIKAIAVTWGFNSKQVLAAHNPDFLIDQPQELIEVIRKCN